MKHCYMCGKPLDNKYQLIFHVLSWHTMIEERER